jgi:hypothetical protein
MDEKVKIYAIPFMQTPISCDEKYLMREKFLLECELNIFTDTSIAAMKKPVAKAKIDMKQLRMIMIFSNKKRFYLDAFGVCQYQGKEYFVFPWLFLYLMAIVTHNTETKKGKKEVYIRLWP